MFRLEKLPRESGDFSTSIINCDRLRPKLRAEQASWASLERNFASSLNS
ncbi:MAG: hypothetical protein ACTS42_01510 [Candidatus Hodgkinia cicadicola]